jgi:hypothetical protein
VAWLSLDTASEPASFWTYVVTALQGAVPDVAAGALEVIASSDVLTEVVLTSVLNELAATPNDVLLILDDYHLVASNDVGAGVALLIGPAACYPSRHSWTSGLEIGGLGSRVGRRGVRVGRRGVRVAGLDSGVGGHGDGEGESTVVLLLAGSGVGDGVGLQRTVSPMTIAANIAIITTGMIN